jgi:type VI secretion system protein ImpF
VLQVASREYEIRVVPSVLDRLFDEDPENSREGLPTRAETVRAYRAAVQQDLENLLNTRNTFSDLSADFVEVRRSVIAYGLPDLTSATSNSSSDQERIRQLVKSVIETFEPRLTNVVAELVQSTSDERSVRLRVEARLQMDPTPERIGFDILMPMRASKYEVRERA